VRIGALRNSCRKDEGTESSGRQPKWQRTYVRVENAPLAGEGTMIRSSRSWGQAIRSSPCGADTVTSSTARAPRLVGVTARTPKFPLRARSRRVVVPCRGTASPLACATHRVRSASRSKPLPRALGGSRRFTGTSDESATGSVNFFLDLCPFSSERTQKLPCCFRRRSFDRRQQYHALPP
jgi:hypothetical protein